MNRTEKSIISLLLALVMLVGLVPMVAPIAGAVTQEELDSKELIGDSSSGTKQCVSYSCLFMERRRVAIETSVEEAKTVSKADFINASWTGTGTRDNFSYATANTDFSFKRIRLYDHASAYDIIDYAKNDSGLQRIIDSTAIRSSVDGATTDSSKLISVLCYLLDKHREGIVIWDSDYPHAVLALNYEIINGETVIYCADPVKTSLVVKLGETAMTGNSRDAELSHINSIWIIANANFCDHSYISVYENGKYISKCEKCGQYYDYTKHLNSADAGGYELKNYNDERCYLAAEPYTEAGKTYPEPGTELSVSASVLVPYKSEWVKWYKCGDLWVLDCFVKKVAELPKPSTPINFTGVANQSGNDFTFSLSWDKVDGATSYNIEYKKPAAGTWQALKESPLSTNGVTTSAFSGISSYSSITFRVCAVNAAGNSEWAETSVPLNGASVPATPTGISGVWNYNSKTSKYDITLNWNAVAGATKYKVNYKSSDGKWYELDESNGKTGTVTTNSVVAHDFSTSRTSIDFQIVAVNSSGTQSSPAEATIYKNTPTYTVTYDANNGTGAPVAQTKTQGTALTLSSTKPTRSSSSAGSYIVTLNANGGSVSSTSLSVNRTTSYTFKNWNTAANGSGTAYNSGASYTADASVTLYAQWNSETTTSAVNLPTSTRSGYTFKGWAESASATSGDTGSFTPTGNVTLYAIWQANIPSRPVVSLNKTEVYTEDAITASWSSCQNASYYDIRVYNADTQELDVFSSWSYEHTSIDISGLPAGHYSLFVAAVNDELRKAGSDDYYLISDTVDFSVLERTYTVTYNANGGTGALEAQTKTHGTNLILSDVIPTRDGYTFLGWAESAEATEAVYQPGESFTKNADMTLYAVWEKAEAIADCMSHAEYIAADLDEHVIIETYVQAHQSWWDGKIIIYAQSPDGAYFIYDANCSEDIVEKLLPGTKIRVEGWKTEWAGLYEIADGSFEIIEADSYLATATDVTNLLGTDSIINHQNELVSFTGMTIVPYDSTGAAVAYQNDVNCTGDLFFKAEKNGIIYDFMVEYYLCDESTDVYRIIETLEVGEAVDLEGFLYWNNGPKPHITAIKSKTPIQNTIIASGDCGWDGNNLTWELDSYGVLTVDGQGEMINCDKRMQPWNEYIDSIKSVVIKPGVTTIGVSAFENGIRIRNVDIPSSVTSIGASAFDQCYSIKRISIGNGVTSIGTAAFSVCNSLKEVYYAGSEADWEEIDVGYSNNQLLNATFHYATADSYTVDFNANGGEDVPKAQTKTHGTTLTLSYEIPTRNGYTFLGWAESSGAQVAEYQPGDSYARDEDITLYAVWEQSANNVSHIKVADIKSKPGKSVDVIIEIDNNPGIAVLGFNIGYDNTAMTLKSITANDVFSSADIIAGDSSKNPYVFSAMNASADIKNNGKLITLTFDIKEDCKDGDYYITLSDVESYNIDEETVTFTTVDGKITIKNIELGDVTGDGKVNRLDLLRLGKRLAGWDVEIEEDAADVTGDGKVNRLDLLRLGKYLAGWDVTLG